jgi:hypothetical protein
VLLAEELALIATKPTTRRHALGTRSQLNACLAGLLIADLVLSGGAELDGARQEVRLTGTTPHPDLLVAVAAVVADKGPKVKSVLSGMDRGLRQHGWAGPWDAASAPITRGDAGAPERDEIVTRLRHAAAIDGPADRGTALVLAMTGPANLLEVVAPERGPPRKHARARIDHGLDGTSFECLPTIVRKLIQEAQAAASAVAG